MHEWWTHYCNYALAILSVSTTSFAAARDEAGQQGHLRSPRRDCFLTPTSAKTQASHLSPFPTTTKTKKNFAHARIGLPLTGNRGWVSLKQSIPGSQCRPCFPDAGFTYCSCRQSARQGLRYPRYLGAENGGTPCLLCHPHSDSHGSKMCETHSAETYAQWVSSSHVMILSYVGRRRSQWCLSWSATFESRLKSHFSHITPTLFTVPNRLHSTSDFLPRLLRAWLYGLEAH